MQMTTREMVRFITEQLSWTKQKRKEVDDFLAKVNHAIKQGLEWKCEAVEIYHYNFKYIEDIAKILCIFEWDVDYTDTELTVRLK